MATKTKTKSDTPAATRAPRVQHNITAEQVVKSCYRTKNAKASAAELGVPVTTLWARIRTLKKNGVPFPDFVKSRTDYVALKALAESLSKPEIVPGGLEPA